jgi:hypothetical protein
MMQLDLPFAQFDREVLDPLALQMPLALSDPAD